MSQPLAVIDIGTNTVRLLVARPAPGGGLEQIVDRSATVRLGQGVDASGRLAPERMERAAAAVAELADQARELGATPILALATSAVRDAGNRAEFLVLVRERSGLPVEIIDGDREARLTFQGALLGRPAGGWRLVVDIGGGSTEVIAARDGEIVAARSFQLGSGRLTERCLTSDPPSPAEIERGRALAAETLAEAPAATADEVVIVGGTASALLRLTPRAAGDDRLTRPQLDEALAALLAVPAATFAAGGAVDRDRARVLPGGILIIQTILDRFSLDAASISRGGIREGALLEHLAARGAGGS